MSCYFQFKSHAQKSVQPACFLGFTPASNLKTGGADSSTPVTLIGMKHRLRKERWLMVKMRSHNGASSPVLANELYLMEAKYDFTASSPLQQLKMGFRVLINYWCMSQWRLKDTKFHPRVHHPVPAALRRLMSHPVLNKSHCDSAEVNLLWTDSSSFCWGTVSVIWGGRCCAAGSWRPFITMTMLLACYTVSQ